MSDLYLRKRLVSNVFSLLGDKENHITYSIAWGLSRSPQFLRHFIKEVINETVNPESVTISLQEHEAKAGVTDIEIRLPGELHIILEAKRGWNLPGLKQLQQYANRESFKHSKSARRLLVTLSECSSDYALRNLEAKYIEDIQVIHVSWRQVTTCARRAYKSGSYSEKQLLWGLETYLEGLMTTQKTDSNLVFVVSLGSDTPEGWGISWIDIVNKRSLYFHPAAKGWPAVPPNYIAFRYHGKLQSIHHVEDYEVVDTLNERIPEIPQNKEDKGPRFLYRLGKCFAPAHDVPTGNIYPSGRVWCMLDTLFTSSTIAKARDVTQARERSTRAY